MTVLVLGATGATGKLVVKQLLDRGERVRAIVRFPEKLPEAIRSHGKFSLITAADISRISRSEMAEYLEGCDAVISCLGHNLTLRGIFGPPFRLVADATKLICTAVEESESKKAMKYILMNTTGHRNRDLGESPSPAEKCVLGIIGLLVPPQKDNEKAAEYLRVKIGQSNRKLEWIAVRPDTLFNMDEVSDYSVYPSPVRSPVFNPGKTSRINVAHFMAELIGSEKLWKKWKGQMPVIYDSDSLPEKR